MQVMFHALMTSLLTSQGDKVGQIMKLTIFELERRSKAQNVGNANGYLSGMFNFWYNIRQKKVCRELKMAAILKFFKY